IPMPPPPSGPLGDFTKALFVSHYLHFVAVFQIVGGLLLLIGRFVPLGLVLLAPVIVNIDLVHMLMDPSGLPMAVVISLLLVCLWKTLRFPCHTRASMRRTARNAKPRKACSTESMSKWN